MLGHLLRDIHDLKGVVPRRRWAGSGAEAVHQVYTEAKASEIPRAQPGHRTPANAGGETNGLEARPFLKDPLAVQAKLCRRMERFIKELVFVSDPAVPSANNAAERSLRHLVTSRKISGGTRFGTDSKMTLASLFGTWRARGLNPLLECRRLLTSASNLNSFPSAHRLDLGVWSWLRCPLLRIGWQWIWLATSLPLLKHCKKLNRCMR